MNKRKNNKTQINSKNQKRRKKAAKKQQEKRGENVKPVKDKRQNK